MRANVMDAKDASRRDRSGDGRADRSRGGARTRGRVAEHLAERALAREADEHRAPERGRSGRGGAPARGSGRASCRSRCPGSRQTCSLGNPGGDREREPLLEKRRPRRRRRRRSAGRPASSAARPACASGRRTRPRRRRRPRAPGRRASAVTSFTITAPSSSARRATSALDGVDRDRQRPRSSSSTGSTRRSSSSSGTPSAPGRVDSPPMSTSAAPRASMRRGRGRGVDGSRCSPPSEKLSGVTLTIPITAGRGQRSSIASPPIRR